MQCLDCIYNNYEITKEVNVSPSFQCRKSYIERKISRIYQDEMDGIGCNIISPISYEDPIEIFIEKTGISKGYYECNNKTYKL